MTDYESRAQNYGFASPRVVIEAIASPGTIILDVRNAAEIAADGKFDKSVSTACTASDCEELRAFPEKFVPNKSASVVVHCKSGRRAAKAKEILVGLGYTGVLNAGGYSDLVAILREKK